MIKSISSFGGAKVLTKEQQRNVIGGGTCQALQVTSDGVHNVIINLTASQAQSVPGMTNWCCDSCSTASWSVKAPPIPPVLP